MISIVSQEFTIKLYDTLEKKEKELKPVEPGFVKIYVCGPTVYDYTHIGHGRTYVVYDALKRYLALRGYNVVHVMNITDIDDKIIKKAHSEKRDWRDIAEEFTKDYFQALNALRVTVDHHPRVTNHIKEIVEFIQLLIDKGYAYVAPSGSVYFDVDKYEDYGRLSGRLEKELWNQEPEFLSEKKKPYDFALWKAAKPGEPYWESPWGKGRPGWHIECSVMSSRYLGERFDIHGGGTDLIFPHHENERAQSEALFGVKPWVSIWMHTGLVTVGADKMSKSLGNIIPLKEAIKKWNPGSIRIWYLHLHYRKPLQFSEESLEQAEKLRERVVTAYELLKKLQEEAPEPHYLNDVDLNNARYLLFLHRRFHEALSDDFNTPQAIAAVNDLLSFIFRELQYKPRYMLLALAMKTLRAFNHVFAAFEETVTESDQLVNELINIVVSVRKELRRRGIYDLSDTIRSELSKLGIQLMDKGLETTWMRIRR
ncbi:MAG: cysteine--tRNA ligase [Desulfurococcaceae archaeon]